MRGKRGLIMGLMPTTSRSHWVSRWPATSRALSSPSPIEARRSANCRAAARGAAQLGYRALPCDVTDDPSLDAGVRCPAGRALGAATSWVHAIGFSDKKRAGVRHVEMTTAANFTQTMLISVHSFTAVVAQPRR